MTGAGHGSGDPGEIRCSSGGGAEPVGAAPGVPGHGGDGGGTRGAHG